jgi:hypothetical protein
MSLLEKVVLFGVGYVVHGRECCCGWMPLWCKDIYSLLHQAK